MNTFEETKLIMKKYNIHPNKNLGQNFLFDENALETISQDVTKDDIVIEIGPGLGTLTSLLLEKAKKVIVIELDSRMIEILEDRFKLYDNIKIINEDVLKIDFEELICKEIVDYNKVNIKVVANLPYYITSEIITKLLKTNIKDITILIQKEVADRICAIPGQKQAGAITYLVYYYSDAKIIKNVSKECFIPNPKVESSIVKINKLTECRVIVKDEELFFKIIKENFSKRRKTITNSLGNIIPKEKLIPVLQKLNIPENVRGEELNIKQYAEITNVIIEQKLK